MEILEKEGWPLNAVHMCELLHTSCMSVTESASERGLSTPAAFATQLCNLSVGYSQIKNVQVGGKALSGMWDFE